VLSWADFGVMIPNICDTRAFDLYLICAEDKTLGMDGYENVC
jgi:hypothetical protein